MSSDVVGDEDLTAAFESHARELRVFCYRMTGSLTDADDLSQETFLRAWRCRHDFRRAASARTWLYRIATNACLDFLAKHERRAAPAGSVQEVLEQDGRLDPFPDRCLASGQLAPDPAAVAESRETTELLLVAALLLLHPRQRIAVIARDFLELSAAETASLLQTSVPSVNSLVQRGRAQIRRDHPTPRGVREADPLEQEHVRRYVAAHHDGDAAAILAMLAAEVRVHMPPEEPCLGRDAVAQLFTRLLGPTGPGDWWLIPVRANGRPATANYLRRRGESELRATSVDVLDIHDGRLTSVQCFLGSSTFAAFGLPLTTIRNQSHIDEAPRRAG